MSLSSIAAAVRAQKDPPPKTVPKRKQPKRVTGQLPDGQFQYEPEATNTNQTGGTWTRPENNPTPTPIFGNDLDDAANEIGFPDLPKPPNPSGASWTRPENNELDIKTTPTTIEELVEETKLEGKDYTDQAMDELEASFIQNYDTAQKFGIELPYQTFKEYKEWLTSASTSEMEALKKQQEIARELEASKAKTAMEQMSGATAAQSSAMAQSREGAGTSTAGQFRTEFSQQMDRQKNQIALQRRSAEQARQTTMERMERAQEQGNIDLADALGKQLFSIERNIRQIDNDALKTAVLAKEQALAEEEFTQTKTTDLVDSFDKMGFGLADIGQESLEAMIEGTNMSLTQALAFKESARLKKEAAETKNEAESAYKLAQAAKIDAETAQVGKPASVQEFEYYNTLTPEQQTKFKELNGSGFTFKQMEDGSIIAFDPNTGKGHVAFEEGTLGQGVTIEDVGNGIITQNYGDTSLLKIDNVLLADGSVGTPGIDIAGRKNSPIPSTVTGEVTFVGKNGGYGNQVVVTTNLGEKHMFNHLNSMNVEVGQEINAGDLLGGMGNTGSVISMGGDGTHLDYRVKSADGKWLDPNQYFGKGVSIPGLNDIIANAKQMVSSVTAQKDVEANIRDFAKTGDKKALQSYIKNLAQQDLDAEGKKTWRIRSNIVAQGEKLKTKMDEFEALGGDMGIFSGAWTKLVNKIGQMDNPKKQAIAQDMRMMIEDFARAQTGAAIQDFERVEFGKILPDLYDGKDLAKAKIDAFANYQQTVVENTIREKLGDTAYESLYGVDTGGSTEGVEVGGAVFVDENEALDNMELKYTSKVAEVFKEWNYAPPKI